MTARPAIRARAAAAPAPSSPNPRGRPVWECPTTAPATFPILRLPPRRGHDGYLVYNAGQLAVFGGTSAGTPAFAGIVALLNQYLVSTGAQTAPGVGNINPRLYALAQSGRGAFHDVTSGDNIVNVTCGARTRNCVAGSYGYSAGQGYDQASGLGSIDAYNLVTAWSPTGVLRAGGRIRRPAVHRDLRRLHRLAHHHRHRNRRQRRHPYRERSRSPRATNRSASRRSAARGRPPPPASRSAPRNSRSAPIASWPVIAAIPRLNAATGTISHPGHRFFLRTAGDHRPGERRLLPPGLRSRNGAHHLRHEPRRHDLDRFHRAAPRDRCPESASPSAASNAPLYYVSPGQLNVQIPYETPVNQSSVLTVTNNGRSAIHLVHRRCRRTRRVHRFERRDRAVRHRGARRRVHAVPYRRGRRISGHSHRRGSLRRLLPSRSCRLPFRLPP